MNDISDRIRIARKRKNYTQTYVAKKLGMDRTNLSRIENNKQSFTLSQLKLFCECCDVSADVILDIKSNNKKVYDIERSNEFFKIMENALNDMKK